MRNIGIPAWVKVKGWESNQGEYWSREIGYDRIANDWHIAIRERHGHEAYPEDDTVYTWSFNNAPRKSRIAAVNKIPDLLSQLVKEAERIARRLREKTIEVNALAATLSVSVTQKKIRK
jgi:hypothetical protein